MFRKVLFVCFFILLGINLFFCSWYVLHGDVNFSSDIGRDFLLLKELDQKKIVFIGPRSSVPGLYHGPLWLYLTYPGFLIGNGNPVVMGWYWIFLIVCFLISCYFIAKNLFGELCASLFVLMTSLYLVYHAKGLFNPHGALFLLPAFFYFFIRYTQTLKLRYLIIHILIAGALIQFQMAVGAPFFLLSFLYVLFFAVKQNKKVHLFAFALILVPLATFILFDLRHNFLLFHSALTHIKSGNVKHDILYFLENRTQIALTGIEFLRYGPPNGNLYASLIFLVFLAVQIKTGKYRSVYLTFLYFYIGFFALSLLNRYDLLYFYVFPLFPFVFLFFTSLVTSKYRYFFILIYAAVYVINFAGIIDYLQSANSIIGKKEDSWKALYTVASDVFKGTEEELGYFVYSPDILGYSPKYAMNYTQKQYKKTAHSFEKKPVTYLVIAPPPRGNPYMKDEWWTKHQVNINSQAKSRTTYESGYKLEKYVLNADEIKISFDPSINPGIHFR